MSADEDISNDRNVMIFTQCFSHTNALNILVGMSATAMFQWSSTCKRNVINSFTI